RRSRRRQDCGLVCLPRRHASVLHSRRARGLSAAALARDPRGRRRQGSAPDDRRARGGVRALKARRRALAGAAATATVAACSAFSMELDRGLRMPQAPRTAPPIESSAASVALKLTPALGSGPRARYPRATQPLIVTLTVNADPKGERIVRMNDAAEFLVRADDLAEVAA